MKSEQELAAERVKFKETDKRQKEILADQVRVMLEEKDAEIRRTTDASVKAHLLEIKDIEAKTENEVQLVRDEVKQEVLDLKQELERLMLENTDLMAELGRMQVHVRQLSQREAQLLRDLGADDGVVEIRKSSALRYIKSAIAGISIVFEVRLGSTQYTKSPM